MRTLVLAFATLLSAPAFAQVTTTPGATAPAQPGTPVINGPASGQGTTSQPCVGLDCNQYGSPNVGITGGAQPTCTGINCQQGVGLSGSSSTTTPGSALGTPETN